MSTTPEHVIWHDVECGRYDADMALWHELAQAADGPILDVGAGHRPRDARARAPRPRGRGARSRPRSAGDARERAAEPGCPSRRSSPTRPASSSTVATSRSSWRRCRPSSCSARTAGAAFCAPRGHTSQPAGSSRSRWSTRSRHSTSEHVPLPLPDQLVRRRRRCTRAIRSRCVTTGHRRDRANPADRHRRRAAQRKRRRPAPGSRRADEVAAEGVTAGLTLLPGRVIDATDEHVGTTVVLLRG